jgi:hypothetical protein
MHIRRLASVLALATLFVGACGPKAAPKPVAPPPPPDVTLGGACKAGAQAGAEGHCASGLTCTTAGGASFCAAPCPCSGGGACVATPSHPEMCLKTCSGDGDCGGLSCSPDWGVCAPAGLLAGKPPACTEAALARKSFGAVTQVSKADKGSHDPALAFDRDGNLVVVHAAGGAASKLDRNVPLEKENAGDPWLATDRAGRLFLALLGWNGGAAESGMMVGVSTSDDGTTWSKPAAAHDAATDCAGDVAGCLDKPIVAIGPDRDNPKIDVVYAIYWSNVSGSLRATHSTDGGQSFSPSAQVGTGAFADAEVTSSGKLHVVYASGGGGNRLGDTGNGIYYTSSSDTGESFAPATRVSSEADAVPYYFNSPRVIVDVPRRMLYTVYTAGTPDGKWDIFVASSKDGGVTWPTRTKVNDDGACATHMLPAAALDPSTGRVHVIWVENRSGAGAVAYASCASGGTSCGKNEAVSEAPFAAFGFGRRSAATLGDHIGLAYNAKKKELHAVWTQPVDEGGAAVGRIFHSVAKLK